MKRLFSLIALLAFVAAPAMAQFGATVAVSGDQLIAGGSSNDLSPGALYIYEMGSDGMWAETGSISASAGMAGDRFGRSASISGNWMAVGAPGANSVYFFERMDDGTWAERGALTEDVDGFGGSVLMDGDHMLVAVGGGFRSAGSVHAYMWTEDGWAKKGSLTPEVEEEGGLRGFPSSMALSNGRAAVSSSFANERSGAVWTFKYEGDEWVSDGTADVPYASANAGTGSALMMVDGEYLAVGMPGHDNRMGSVAVFRNQGEGWQFDMRMSPYVSEAGARFGSSLHFANNTAYVGATGNGGMIYAFPVGMDGIQSTSVIAAEGLDSNASFGATMAVGEQVAVIGATGQENRSGVAVPFSVAGDEWVQGNYVYRDPKGYESVTGGMVECEADEAGAFPCKDVNMLSFLDMGDLGADRGIRTNDIWGWEDPETGREYALVGLTNQTSFVDVTDAENPVYLGRLMLTDTARPAVWRDMKVYKDHAYIVADGANQHGMQVFDLRQLRDFDGTPEEFEMTAYYDQIASAHNIVINEETGFAYSVGSSSGGETCGGGLHMIDIREPANPQFAGCFADGNSGRRGTGYSHDAQCVIYRGPDSDYSGREICLGSNETALSISDVTDKSAPTSISIASYPNVAYAHQGWLTEDHRFFYMNDEGDEPQGLVEGTRTLIWDLTDLDEPVLAGEHVATTTETDHNLYIKGDIMYQSNYGAGFRVLDISNRTAPVEIAYFDTSPQGGGGGSWSNYPYFKSGTIVVTGGSNGLFILKKKEIDT
ncbi:MAG: choice-of-anchor B family protein [Rhodothermales bacterium]|nr:choice-of-anchor B family protein [Rhodothermales bacterium]